MIQQRDVYTAVQYVVVTKLPTLAPITRTAHALTVFPGGGRG